MEVGYKVFPGGKRYAYVMVDNHQVFLRNILFIHNTENPSQIAIVHEWGMPDNRWEPPKGQFEWDELGAPRKGAQMTQSQILQAMRRGILRETKEEAKILPSELLNFRQMNRYYSQIWDAPSAPPGAYFLYQFWQAEITPKTMLEAQKRMQELVKNKDWKHLLPADILEKDAIRWWNPTIEGYKNIRSGFSKKMTADYVILYKAHQ
jgi:hypothetical protein